MDNKSEIEYLIDEEKVLLSSLSENRLKQRQILDNEFCLRYGVDVGDEVLFTHRKQTLHGIISRIEHSGFNYSWFIATLFKKDGTIGARETYIWNPETIKKI